MPTAAAAAAVRVAELGYARFFQPPQRLLEIEIEVETGPDEGAALVASCGAGATATLLALADSRVYGWGTELAGELLLGVATTATTTNESSSSDGKRHDAPSPSRALLPLPAPLLSGARSVRAMACGPHHVLMAVAGGGVWAWGLDVNGQTLGLGGCGRRLCLECAGGEEAAAGVGAAAAAVIVPAPRQVAGLEGAEIKVLAAGENHALVVSADGRGVWAWGCGTSGQLGVGRRRPRTGQVVAEDREVCSCRPLPLDVPALDSSSPSPTTTTTIAHAAVGKRHSLLLTRGGEVWSFGSGLYHALGHGRTDNEWAPRRVAALEGIGEMRPDGRFVGGMAAVACGAWHSLALSRSGDAYGWGWNRWGQLGAAVLAAEGDGGGGCGGSGASAATLVPVPRLLRVGRDEEGEEDDVEFVQIGAGVHYSAGLKRGGRLYVWGTLGLAHNDDDADDAASSSSPNTEAAQQPESWDLAGLLQLEQAVAGVASLGLACGPYHLAVFGGGGRPQQA